METWPARGAIRAPEEAEAASPAATVAGLLEEETAWQVRGARRTSKAPAAAATAEETSEAFAKRLLLLRLLG